MTADQFSSWHLPSVLSTLSHLTGTPSDQWKATFTAKTNGRALLQASATTDNSSSSNVVAVSMSILTRNPQLVVFRLAQAPATASATTAGSPGNGCTTELCNRLLAAGVPVDPSSVVITPDMLAYQFGSTPTASPLDEKLAATQRISAIVGASVGGAVLLVILLFTHK